MFGAFTIIFIIGIIVFLLVTLFLLCFTRSSIELPISLGSFSEYDDWPLDSDDLVSDLSEDARLSYERAKIFQDRHPPDSIPTDITPPQFLSIQEKGVSAFEFEGETDATVFVAGRTELQFMHGECSIQTNLPLPRHQEVYYWEAKMFDKPESTTVSVGVATKPYPSWRLPGWNRYSIGYFSDNGCKYFSSPFNAKPYGIPFHHGDVIGVGYRHRTGTVFFTRNGRRLEDAYTGLRWNLFPTIGANGPCQIHVNLGQSGFVFVEANVKKWGLAPSQGTRAPPPPYGIETNSILLATASTTVAATAAAGISSSSSSSNNNNRNSFQNYHIQQSQRERPLETIIHVGEEESLLLSTRGGQQLQIPDNSSIPEPPPYSSPRINPNNNNDRRPNLLD